MDNEKSGFWKFIDRFKTIAELTATIIVIFPILVVLLQQGLSATMPIWLVLLVAIFAVFLGYLLGRTVISTSKTSLSVSKHEPLQKIDFNYKDSPLNHKWFFGETQPSFRHISDGYVGDALEITSTVTYRLDYYIDQLASFGSHVEFVAKLDNYAYFLTCIRVKGKDSSQSRDLWLTFCAGNEPPKRNDDGQTWYEFIVHVIPTPLGNGWAKFDLDLKKMVQITGGNEAGWKFSQLKQIRLRGNLSIAYITISKD